jgi:hypothetical protein
LFEEPKALLAGRKDTHTLAATGRHKPRFPCGWSVNAGGGAGANSLAWWLFLAMTHKRIIALADKKEPG